MSHSPVTCSPSLIVENFVVRCGVVIRTQSGEDEVRVDDDAKGAALLLRACVQREVSIAEL